MPGSVPLHRRETRSLRASSTRNLAMRPSPVGSNPETRTASVSTLTSNSTPTPTTCRTSSCTSWRSRLEEGSRLAAAARVAEGGAAPGAGRVCVVGGPKLPVLWAGACPSKGVRPRTGVLHGSAQERRRSVARATVSEERRRINHATPLFPVGYGQHGLVFFVGCLAVATAVPSASRLESKPVVPVTRLAPLPGYAPGGPGSISGPAGRSGCRGRRR